MSVNIADQSRVEETVEGNDIFLYNIESSNDRESCNVLCLFLFFISLFLIMIMTSDNPQTNVEYDSDNMESDILSSNGNDKIIKDIIDNILIKGLNFKGYYKIVENNKNLNRHDTNSVLNKSNDDIETKTGTFEAKLITSKLSLSNTSKSYIFFYFDLSNNEPNKIKNKKYQFIGLNGLNINKNNNYTFNGIGYNISNFCQKKSDKCICNYTINIKQHLSNYESTSLVELDESYLYSLKNYILDESEYYQKYVYDQYDQQYKNYLNDVDTYYTNHFVKSSDALSAVKQEEMTMGATNGEEVGEIEKAGNEESEESKIHDHDYEGYISSNNCNMFISFNGNDIDKDFMSTKLVSFSILFNIKSIIELVLFWFQIGNSENIHNASKISLISICLNSFIEIFESLLLLYEITLSRLMLVHFIVMVLIKFILFSLMEVRYVLIIWKANHHQYISDGWEVMQRKLGKLYKYYYGSIFILIILFYYVFPYFPYILLVLYLCWLPQILLDIWKGQRYSINLKFAFFLSLCRLFLPIYIFIYPYNIFRSDIFSQLIEAPNITFSILLIVIMSIQLVCMYIQRKYGPRHFVNIDLLPYVHNYYMTIDANFELEMLECVICMYDIRLKQKKYCVTPCYHIFHEKCLRQWMNIKLECPTCRGVLPIFP